MRDDDESFAAFERSMSRTRSVLEAEHERAAKGYPPDEALLKHGAEIEDEITRTLAPAAEKRSSANRRALILPFKIEAEERGKGQGQ